MATKNDVTGDSLVSKPLSKAGEENWDRIFGKKENKGVVWNPEGPQLLTGWWTNPNCPTAVEYHLITKEDPIKKEFPHNILRQPRIDVIGQNGNDGDHYGRSSEN